MRMQTPVLNSHGRAFKQASNALPRRFTCGKTAHGSQGAACLKPTAIQRSHIVARVAEATRQPEMMAQQTGVDAGPGDYDASHIQVLEGLEPVRKRPGMYIGSTGQAGLHHLVYEVLDNSIDEVQAGHATRVEVEMDLATGWVTITDDGRGIPTDVHERTGKSALETVLTVLHAGGKFGGKESGYSVSGGLHGVGISVVNALSERTEVRVWRGGVQYFQAFSRGAVLCNLQTSILPPEQSARRGTQVRFLYDPTVFAPEANYDPETIRTRLRELAFLNSAATILFKAIPDPNSGKRGSKAAAAAAAAVTSSDTLEYLDGTYNGNGNGNGHHNGNGLHQPPVTDITHVCPWQQGDPVLSNGTASSTGAYSVTKAKTRRRAPSKSKQEPTPVESPQPDSPTNLQEGAESPTTGVLPAPSMALHPNSLDGAMVADGWHVYHYEGGLKEFVTWINQGKQALHDVLYFQTTAEGVVVEVALQWCADVFSDTLTGFANSIRTIDGGMHLDGTRAALTRTINSLAKKLKLVKEGDPTLTGDNIREGLGGVISVKVPNPEFEGQTKTRLGNPEVRRIVEVAVARAIGEQLELNPTALTAIVGKALTAARAADAAKKARELVRRKAVLTRTTLPGKLADCTSSKREETEIFVVEGDSAGGSAKQARDRVTQAILPLRGKILNVERKEESSMLKNNEITSLVVALGLGVKGEGCAGLRYGKVVILTDADVDGAHIRTLLLTFLFRFRPELFEEGRVYVAVPPLYKIEENRGKKLTWCFSDQELKQVTSSLSPGSYTVQRFKGLGEMMPEQLWETTMDPARRLLRRLTVRDAAEASKMFAVLMGSKVAPRRELIESEGARFTAEVLDI